MRTLFTTLFIVFPIFIVCVVAAGFTPTSIIKTRGRISSATILQVTPSSIASAGQVNVTYRLLNVERLFGWQVSVYVNSTVEVIDATLTKDDIFVDHPVTGLIEGSGTTEYAALNTLLGSDHVTGSGTLVQFTFRTTAPVQFKIDTERTFFLDSDLETIDYIIEYS